VPDFCYSLFVEQAGSRTFDYITQLRIPLGALSPTLSCIFADVDSFTATPPMGDGLRRGPDHTTLLFFSSPSRMPIARWDLPDLPLAFVAMHAVPSMLLCCRVRFFA
jgi:hypothetical protein